MNVQPQILCYRTVFIRAIMFDICIQPNKIKSHWSSESDKQAQVHCPAQMSYSNEIFVLKNL